MQVSLNADLPGSKGIHSRKSRVDPVWNKHNLQTSWFAWAVFLMIAVHDPSHWIKCSDILIIFYIGESLWKTKHGHLSAAENIFKNLPLMQEEEKSGIIPRSYSCLIHENTYLCLFMLIQNPDTKLSAVSTDWSRIYWFTFTTEFLPSQKNCGFTKPSWLLCWKWNFIWAEMKLVLVGSSSASNFFYRDPKPRMRKDSKTIKVKWYLQKFQITQLFSVFCRKSLTDFWRNKRSFLTPLHKQ